MNKWKRLPVIALLVMLLAITGTRTVTAEMLDMNEFNDDMITVNIHNTGTKGDNNIEKIRLAKPHEYEQIMEREFGEAGDEDDEGELRWYDKSFPFEADSSTFKEKDINVKPGSSKAVTLSYKLRRDLSAGYYQAFFIIDDARVGVNIWVSAYDGSTEEDENTKIEYDFSIGDGQFTPFAAYNQVMNFGVNLTNTGLKKVYDVRVEMQLDADVTKFPFNINEGNYSRKMGDMEPGQMVTVPYSMAVREDVKSGFFPIHYLVSYREEENGDFSEPVDLIFYVRVKGEDDDKLSSDAGEEDRTKARIIVDSFSTVPEEVFAGQPFELRVRMKNASSNVTSSNIMFTFASEEVESSPVFTSDSGSTSMVVKSYTMTIKEQYDSPEFKNAKEEVKISIPVKQVPRLNTGTIEVMPDSINVGSETNVMFGINNTGKVLLYNVMVRFEADSIQTTDAYVGNIKPGETGNLDTMVSGVAPTTDEGKVKIIISYEDENGLTTEVEKEMILFVNEPMDDLGGMEAGNMDVDGMGGAGGMDGMNGEQTFFSRYKKVIFPAAALCIIIIGTTVIVIRKKKKAAQEEGMDDEIL